MRKLQIIVGTMGICMGVISLVLALFFGGPDRVLYIGLFALVVGMMNFVYLQELEARP